MWKNTLDVFPGEWVGTDHEKEITKELVIGDMALVAVDSQFQDYSDIDSMIKLPRRIGTIGCVVETDGDVWGYKLLFDDGGTNWFKRYHLQKQDALSVASLRR